MVIPLWDQSEPYLRWAKMKPLEAFSCVLELAVDVGTLHENEVIVYISSL